MPVSRKTAAAAEPKTEIGQQFKRLLNECRREDEFTAGFQRSSKGNLWRTWDGRTVTVFRREDGTYSWCIGDGNGVRYSPMLYESEEGALGELWWVIEGQFTIGPPPCCPHY